MRYRRWQQLVNGSGARLALLDEHVLRTALGPPERAGGAWEQLKPCRDELWTPPTTELLPLLSRTLVEAGIAGPEIERLQQAASRAWLGNQLLFRRLGVALDVLDAAGVRTMALKGVPLVLRHYSDPSLRPMGDFDLLVEPGSAPDALAALVRAGWTHEWILHPDFVARTSEVPCRPPDGTGILDLHWRLVPWVGRSADAPDPALWESATPLAVGDHMTLGPAPHDLLLHVILHAFKSGWAAVPRWVADVVVLLRSAGDGMEWDTFVDRVVRSHLVVPVVDALKYLTVTFEVRVPQPALAALVDAHPTRRELRKYRRALQPTFPRHGPLLGGAPDLRDSWTHLSINFSRAGVLRSLGPFLRGRMHVDRIWVLPFVVTARRLQRTRIWRGMRGDLARPTPGYPAAGRSGPNRGVERTGRAGDADGVHRQHDE